MTWSLELITGPRAGARFMLGDSPLVVGRNPLASLPFPEDSFLSNRHCMLESTASGVSLKDLNSTNGTFLNGQRVTDAQARSGDVIKAGSLTIRIAPGTPEVLEPVPALSLPVVPLVSSRNSGLTRVIAAMPTMVGMPAVEKPPPALAFLESRSEPLYCLVDGARDPEVHALIEQTLEPHLALYDGESTAHLAQWNPYLVNLAPGSECTRTLLKQGWGNGWASFFTSPASFEALRQHFRKFLMVQIEGGREVYFRFYDPRVMRDFLPAANQNEITTFFGPVSSFLLEGEEAGVLLQMSRSAEGLVTERIIL